MTSNTKRVLSKNAIDFIDDAYLESLIGKTPDPKLVRDILDKSRAKEPLTVPETAALVNTQDPELIQAIFDTAKELKQSVYGNRIVFFAPLYAGNKCVNDCEYCAYKVSNKDMTRSTLSDPGLRDQVLHMTSKGHKRLILVFGEHPNYDANFIASKVRTIYEAKKENQEIRRVNINAAPMDHEGFSIIKDAGIGTYQIFQETYHHATYQKVHPKGTFKGDYMWRLDSLSRAYEAGCDDMGIGALFGLYDWRFEVLGLVSHSRHLMEKYNVGPHTISFPRINDASGVDLDPKWFVNDEEFKRLVAILRLSVPYAGMILTAREPAHLRKELLDYGVSQIDAGSRIDIGGYSADSEDYFQKSNQFELSDMRSLDEIMSELIDHGEIPSFCTACYRNGRTGEQFMEFAIPGFIEKFCTPNALLTFMEYLVDFASDETKKKGEKLIESELAKIPDSDKKKGLVEKLRQIKEESKRDLYY